MLNGCTSNLIGNTGAQQLAKRGRRGALADVRPAMRALADRVMAGISGGAGSGARKEYNAVHLRLEKDARDWSAIMGGEAVRPDRRVLFLHPWALLD